MNKLSAILSLIPFLLFSQGMPEHFLEALPELPSSSCNSTRDYKTDYLSKVDKVLDDLQEQKNKTEEQLANSMDQEKILKMNSAAANGNISTEDLKKMEGMSDEEQAAFIQKLMKDAMKNPEKNSPNNTSRKVEDLKRRRNEQAEFTALWNKRFKDFSDSIKAIQDDADIFHYDNIKGLKEKQYKLMGEGKVTAEQKRLAEQYQTNCEKYCDMFTTRLFVQLRDYKEFIKSQLANIRKYEKNVYTNSGTESPDLAALAFVTQYAGQLKTVFKYDLLGEQVL